MSEKPDIGAKMTRLSTPGHHRDVLKLPEVKAALKAWRADKTPYLRHQFATALHAAGVTDSRVRERLIDSLGKTKAWG